MLVLLPPSETKTDGGDGAPLELDALSFPELNPIRERLVSAVVDLAANVPACLAALGLSERQASEVTRNATLRSSPTMPAISRYTGVLYDGIDLAGFTKVERRRAGRRLAVASALFGVLRADDPIPAYRLSGGTVLPDIGGLRPVWQAALSKTLSTVDDLTLDLRSGAYANLAPIPHAVVVSVVTEDGQTISHVNKLYKGQLAAALAKAPREPTSVRGVIKIAAAEGIRLRPSSPKRLELIVPGPQPGHTG
jgi:cytoplasmic iron level regulating protein YaaA (DUF328/UPF0246 family)